MFHIPNQFSQTLHWSQSWGCHAACKFFDGEHKVWTFPAHVEAQPDNGPVRTAILGIQFLWPIGQLNARVTWHFLLASNTKCWFKCFHNLLNWSSRRKHQPSIHLSDFPFQKRNAGSQAIELGMAHWKLLTHAFEKCVLPKGLLANKHDVVDMDEDSGMLILRQTRLFTAKLKIRCISEVLTQMLKPLSSPHSLTRQVTQDHKRLVLKRNQNGVRLLHLKESILHIQTTHNNLIVTFVFHLHCLLLLPEIVNR